jgi:hypothetical protein
MSSVGTFDFEGPRYTKLRRVPIMPCRLEEDFNGRRKHGLMSGLKEVLKVVSLKSSLF